MATDFIFRPLAADWPSDGRARYGHCRFRANYSDTMQLLRDELRRIGVRRAVIELDITERDIRLDNLPRSDARPSSPRVRLSFDHPKVGPLQYPCDTYHQWQDNLRAIAKTLEAQRAMDRYGATRHHQQYAGWRALPPPAGGGDAPPVTRVGAAAVLKRESCGNGTQFTVDQILTDPEAARRAYKMAAFRTHPDRGGAPGTFQLVRHAAELLGAT